MDIIIQFLIVFKGYLIEIIPYLIVGFLLSGVISEFIPSDWVDRHLGNRGIKAIFYSTIAGTFLPICCLGSLPVAVSLHRKGANLGPVLAFLVATPATSLTALFVTYGFLGLKFTIFIFFAVILIGLIMGIIGNFLNINIVDTADKGKTTDNIEIDPVCGMKIKRDDSIEYRFSGKNYYFCSLHCMEKFKENPDSFSNVKKSMKTTGERFKGVLRYAFIDMVRDIGPELLLGIILAAVVASIAPVGKFINMYLDGGFAYIFSVIFGLIMYICSTASVPLVHAFIQQGMNVGAGMVLLIIGPITSWGTILVLKKEFGFRTLGIYLIVLIIMTASLGYIFSLI